MDYHDHQEDFRGLHGHLEDAQRRGCCSGSPESPEALILICQVGCHGGCWGRCDVWHGL